MEAEPNSAIKDFVTGETGPKDWGPHETVNFLYGLFDTYRFTFFSPTSDEQLRMPQTVIAVAAMRHDTLAAYRLSYNPNGLPFEILINSLWMERPQWELAETLLHETVHLYQEYMSGKDQDRTKGDKLQGCKSGYHNKQFVEIAEEVGLHPLLGVGAHWKPADGQFEKLMGFIGVEKPEAAKGEFSKPDDGKKSSGTFWWDGDRGRKKGTSTLTLYTSESCQQPSPCKVRSGRRDLHLSCDSCGGKFSPQSS